MSREIGLRGRASELAEIKELVRTCAAGQGGALFLSGRPGSGKTALLAAAAAAASASHVVLRLPSSQAEAALPMAGLHQLLGALLAEAGDLPSGQASSLLSELEEGLSSPGPLLAARLLRVVRTAAAARPLLLCLDDVHQMDDSSWPLLVFVARRIGTDRVAVLLTASTSCQRDGAAEGIRQLRLPDLDQGASRLLLMDLGCGEDVAGLLVPIAGGNPGALADLARSLTPEQRQGQVPPPETLPESSPVRQHLERQLRTLPPATRQVLLLAATDELITTDDLIKAVRLAGRELEDLEPAEVFGLITIAGSGVCFQPGVLRSVIYHQATLAQRRNAHQTLREVLDPACHPLRHYWHRALTAAHPDDRLAAGLSQLVAAGPSGSLPPAQWHALAAQIMGRAAQLATEPAGVFSYRLEAARQCWLAGQPHRAKTLMRALPAAEAPAELQGRLELLAGEIEFSAGEPASAPDALLGAARTLAARDPGTALEALLKAVDALFMSGQDDVLPSVVDVARVPSRDPVAPEIELRLEQLTGLISVFQGDFAGAEGPLRNVLAIAFQLDEPTALLRASTAGILLGDDAVAYRAAERACAVASARDDPATLPDAKTAMGLADMTMGRYDTAASRLLEAVRLALAAGRTTLAGNSQAWLAVIAGMLGDATTCHLRMEQAREAAPHGDAGRVRILGEWAAAALDLAAGKAAEATVRLRTIIGAGTGRVHSIIQIAAAPLLIEAAARSGDRATATEALALFRAWADQAVNPEWPALVARCAALLAEPEDQAEEHYLRARQYHRLASGGFHSACTDLLYGQWLRRRRRPGEARGVLLEAMEAFERLGARQWSDQVAAELRASGYQAGSRGGEAGALAELSAQQGRIARLVASGATNREIADAMFLSTRTVEYHLRNVFAKLGVRSRAELARQLSGGA
ncbi:MAG: AAA family ATPase [Micromonosporaceae bacterium]|nr:AAA family ATPase [Micromonosporaceae bacterium]